MQQKVHVIVTYGGAVAILKQARASIPIVLIAYDPIGSDFVASLSRPGGNVRDYHSKPPKALVSGSNSCVSLSPVFDAWQFCLMPTIRRPRWRRIMFRPWLAISDL